MELLAEASKLPEPQQRKVAAVLGALVADAAGMHYSACFTRLPEYPACKTNQVEFIRGSLYWAVNICKILHINFVEIVHSPSYSLTYSPTNSLDI